jgi:hypothetical protein
MGIVISVSLALLGLAFLSNALTKYSAEVDSGFDSLSAYIFLFDMYFLMAFISGLVFVKGIHFRAMKHMDWAAVLMLIPALSVAVSMMMIYLIPFMRGLVAVMPLMGVTVGIYSLAEWPFSGMRPEKLAMLRRLATVQLLWCLGIAAVFELGVLYQRLLAVMFIYPSLVVMGILLAVEGLWVRDAANAAILASDMDTARRPAPLRLAGAGDITWYGASRSGLSLRTKRLMAVFVLAMTPCIALLASPVDLDIVYASASGGGTAGINVTIVNRGGQAAQSVELWGDGELIARIGRIDGFGVWESKGLDATPNDLIVKVGGAEVASHRVFYPSSCDTIWLAVSLLAAGTLTQRKVRAKKVG